MEDGVLALDRATGAAFAKTGKSKEQGQVGEGMEVLQRDVRSVMPSDSQAAKQRRHWQLESEVQGKRSGLEV